MCVCTRASWCASYDPKGPLAPAESFDYLKHPFGFAHNLKVPFGHARLHTLSLLLFFSPALTLQVVLLRLEKIQGKLVARGLLN